PALLDQHAVAAAVVGAEFGDHPAALAEGCIEAALLRVAGDCEAGGAVGIARVAGGHDLAIALDPHAIGHGPQSGEWSGDTSTHPEGAAEPAILLQAGEREAKVAGHPRGPCGHDLPAGLHRDGQGLGVRMLEASVDKAGNAGLLPEIRIGLTVLQVTSDNE